MNKLRIINCLHYKLKRYFQPQKGTIVEKVAKSTLKCVQLATTLSNEPKSNISNSLLIKLNIIICMKFNKMDKKAIAGSAF